MLPSELQTIVEKGLPIFPCNSLKKPITINGFYDATTDRQKIQEWANKHPGCLWAMPTGKKTGITVLDIDPRHGGHISIENFNIPNTPYVKTGGGGWHYYFKYSPKCKSGSDTIAPGLDIRNDGAYVVIPPSKTDNPYTWCDEELPHSDVPEWMYTEKYEKFNKNFDLKKQGYPIPPGEQDITLFRFVCAMKHQKQPSGMIFDLIKAIINDPNKCPQEKENPFTDKDIERWIRSAFKYPDDKKEDKGKIGSIVFFNPIRATEFKQKNIPPVEWYINGLIQKRGRTMISAKEGMGKSFLLLNMLASVCSGEDSFLGRFKCSQEKPNAMYVDFELGESSIHERLCRMGEITTLPNLFIQSIYNWEILEEEYQLALEQFIEKENIKIIAFDPLGNLWSGDENQRMAVKGVTDYLDYLMDKYSASIVVTHHWRKATQHAREGGEMAAGSYGWTKWLDNHVTIQGTTEKMVISCEKNRNDRKWEKILLSLDDKFLLRYSGTLENKTKFTDDDLAGIFRSFNSPRVLKKDFLERSEKVCSKRTIYDLLKRSKILKEDKHTKEIFESAESTEEQDTFIEEIKESAWDG